MVVDPSGPECPCGKRGCWERFASGSGLGRMARDAAHAGRLDQVVRLAGGDRRVGPGGARHRWPPRPATPGPWPCWGSWGGGWPSGSPTWPTSSTPPSWSYGGGLVETRSTLVLDKVRADFDDLVEGRAVRPEVKILPGAARASGPGPWARRWWRAPGPLPRRRGLSGRPATRRRSDPDPDTRINRAGTMKVGVTLPTFRDDAACVLDAACGPRSSASTGCSSSTTCGPWARPSAPPCRPSPSSGPWPPSTNRVCFGPLGGARRAGRPTTVLVAELLSLGADGPGPAHRRARHGRQQERAREPGLRHSLRPGRRPSPGPAPVRRPICSPRACPCGSAGGRRPPPSWPSTSARPLNLWEGQPAAVAALQARLRGDVGRTGGGRGAPRSRSGWRRWPGPGATWAVCAWPASLEAVAEAAAKVRDA